MKQKFYTMKELPESERPYEKFEKGGTKSLSDAELLAVLIKTGTRQKNSIDLSREILQLHPVYKGLFGLHYLSANELQKVDGIGKIKAAQILCAVELSRRLAQQKKPKRTSFHSPAQIAGLFMEEMRTLDQEHTRVLFLDNRCSMICWEELFIGSVTNCPVNPREILKRALQCDAVSIVLLHNHPSGDPTPSMSDIRFSERMRQAGDLVGITLLDHVILGDCRYVSLKERGHL